MKHWLLWITISASAYAGSGEAGFAFLKIGVSGRAAGVGEAATVLAADATAAFWNPAGLAVNNQNSAVFTYNRWIENVQHNFFAAKWSGGSNAYGVFLIQTGVDDIEQRDIPSEEPQSTFSSHDLAIGISYARRISPSLTAGITAKYVYERLQSSASALACDLGVWYAPSERWRAGAVITQLGTAGKFRDQKVSLPSAVRLGGAYDVILNPDQTVTLFTDVVKPIDDGTKLHTGLEYGYHENIFVRSGYQWGYDAKGWTAGLGMKFLGKFRVDYGYMPLSNGLGTSHRVSAAVEF